MNIISKIVQMLLIASLSFTSTLQINNTEKCIEYLDKTCDDKNSYDGYWWYGYWIPGMVSVDSWFLQQPSLVTGNAVFYAPEAMEATAKYNGLSLKGYVGGVALMFPSEIGGDVWIKRPNQDWEGPFLVVDCARQNDMYGIIVHRNEVIEVDFKTAVRWGLARLGGPEHGGRWTTKKWRLDGVQVSKIPPVNLAGHYDTQLRKFVEKQEPISLEDWFLERVKFSYVREERPLYRPPRSWRIDGVWVTFTDFSVFYP
jgi:hypothetical protein